MTQQNYLAPDGYRYGIMFCDGSIAESFNGATQRERIEAKAREIVAEQVAWCGRHDDIRPVRKRAGDAPWREYERLGYGWPQ